MKSFGKISFALALIAAVGCTSSEPSSVVEGVEQSKIDEYNQMLKESQASMQEGADAAKKGGIKGY
ncbi:MAG: hypothetical protein AAFV88_25105 [Planctomycetota bacterium]